MKPTHNLTSVLQCLDSWLRPSVNSESWDNTGLLVGSGKSSPDEKVINNVSICIDLTPPVLEEAIEKKVDLIIAYHPPLFHPIKKLANNNWKVCLEIIVFVSNNTGNWLFNVKCLYTGMFLF